MLAAFGSARIPTGICHEMARCCGRQFEVELSRVHQMFKCEKNAYYL